MAYTVNFIPVPPDEMRELEKYGVLAVLHRQGERTTIYCRAEKICIDLARSLTVQGTRFSEASIRYDYPVSPRARVRFRRIPPAEMPAPNTPHVSVMREHELVAYLADDNITDDLAFQLELICAEQTRFLVRLPVIAPADPELPRAARRGKTPPSRAAHDQPS